MRSWCVLLLCGLFSVCKNDRIKKETYEATESFGKALVVAPQVWLDCAEFAAPWPATQTAWTPSLRRPNAPEKDQINGKKNGKGTLEMPDSADSVDIPGSSAGIGPMYIRPPRIT